MHGVVQLVTHKKGPDGEENARVILFPFLPLSMASAIRLKKQEELNSQQVESCI